MLVMGIPRLGEIIANGADVAGGLNMFGLYVISDVCALGRVTALGAGPLSPTVVHHHAGHLV